MFYQGGENMDPKALITFEAWHGAVSGAMNGTPTEATKELLRSRVAEKCKFHPPTYHTAWEGRDEFLLLIECVSEVFGTSFTYGRQVITFIMINVSCDWDLVLCVSHVSCVMAYMYYLQAKELCIHMNITIIINLI